MHRAPTLPPPVLAAAPLPSRQRWSAVGARRRPGLRRCSRSQYQPPLPPCSVRAHRPTSPTGHTRQPAQADESGFDTCAWPGSLGPARLGKLQQRRRNARAHTPCVHCARAKPAARCRAGRLLLAAAVASRRPCYKSPTLLRLHLPLPRIQGLGVMSLYTAAAGRRLGGKVKDVLRLAASLSVHRGRSCTAKAAKQEGVKVGQWPRGEESLQCCKSATLGGSGRCGWGDPPRCWPLHAQTGAKGRPAPSSRARPRAA
jgi:hypothetical protein